MVVDVAAAEDIAATAIVALAAIGVFRQRILKEMRRFDKDDGFGGSDFKDLAVIIRSANGIHDGRPEI